MIVGTRAASDIIPSTIDPNPMIDNCCPRSVGGIISACRLAIAMKVPFELIELDCDPFYHGYGLSCSEKQLVFGIWELPVFDLYGKEASILFYICEGDGPLLLGNFVFHPSHYVGSTNRLTITPHVGNISDEEITIPVYTSGEPKDLRT